MSNVPSDEEIEKLAAGLVAHTKWRSASYTSDHAGCYTKDQARVYTEVMLKLRDDTKREVVADMKKERDETIRWQKESRDRLKELCLEAFDRAILRISVSPQHVAIRKLLEAEL